MTDLSQQVVLVAGASSGMGRAIAHAAARAGARVVLAARSADPLEAVRAEVGEENALVVPTDATDRAAVQRLIEATLARWGRIDTLVNSVGANLPRRSLLELTPQSWDGMVASNLTAAFNLSQAVVPVLRQQSSGGLIVHITSMAAKKPNASGAAYQATKAGVVALAHAVMEEERDHGVRTTVIFPGVTDTPFLAQRPVPPTPELLANALQPDDVADACLFVMGLPARAHVPELLLYPSRLRDAYAAPAPQR